MRILDLKFEMLISLGLHILIVAAMLIGASAVVDEKSLKKEEITYIRAMTQASSKKSNEVNRASSPKKKKKASKKKMPKSSNLKKKQIDKPKTQVKKKTIAPKKSPPKKPSVALSKPSVMTPERRTEPQVEQITKPVPDASPVVDRASLLADLNKENGSEKESTNKPIGRKEREETSLTGSGKVSRRGLDGEIKDPKWLEYVASQRKVILENFNFINPSEMTVLSVTVRVRISKNGQLTFLEIPRSLDSGNPAFDKAATNAIYKTAKLAPLPICEEEDCIALGKEGVDFKFQSSEVSD